tara:strand:- start:164 stop:709 length:546 start_codon:yes stop_codon:yes gene_type:complete
MTKTFFAAARLAAAATPAIPPPITITSNSGAAIINSCVSVQLKPRLRSRHAAHHWLSPSRAYRTNIGPRFSEAIRNPIHNAIKFLHAGYARSEFLIPEFMSANIAQSRVPHFSAQVLCQSVKPITDLALRDVPENTIRTKIQHYSENHHEDAGQANFWYYRSRVDSRIDSRTHQRLSDAQP